MTNETQKNFDEEYISSTEVCQKLGISRSALVAGRRRGMLPEPVTIDGANIFIWKRQEVTKALEAWHFTLKARRRELTND